MRNGISAITSPWMPHFVFILDDDFNWPTRAILRKRSELFARHFGMFYLFGTQFAWVNSFFACALYRFLICLKKKPVTISVKSLVKQCWIHGKHRSIGHRIISRRTTSSDIYFMSIAPSYSCETEHTLLRRQQHALINLHIRKLAEINLGADSFIRSK